MIDLPFHYEAAPCSPPSSLTGTNESQKKQSQNRIQIPEPNPKSRSRTVQIKSEPKTATRLATFSKSAESKAGTASLRDPAPRRSNHGKLRRECKRFNRKPVTRFHRRRRTRSPKTEAVFRRAEEVFRQGERKRRETVDEEREETNA